MPDGRGGNRPPRNPAAVSVPQSGRRTDGGPGSSRTPLQQPVRVPSGGAYGERQASEQQQSAAPMAAGGSAVGSPAGGGGGPAPAPAGGAFGPTQRPNESNSQGILTPSQNPAAADPQAVLRILYGQFPHPAIGRLIDTSAYGSRPPR